MCKTLIVQLECVITSCNYIIRYDDITKLLIKKGYLQEQL